MIPRITALIGQQADAFKNNDVEDMNGQLIEICQRVQKQTIGESQPSLRTSPKVVSEPGPRADIGCQYWPLQAS
jgi:hypothetical protein